jgi:hypothetical protein
MGFPKMSAGTASLLRSTCVSAAADVVIEHAVAKMDIINARFRTFLSWSDHRLVPARATLLVTKAAMERNVIAMFAGSCPPKDLERSAKHATANYICIIASTCQILVLGYSDITPVEP